MLSKMRNRKDGFTLIELMIVVAIIGILAAIAIPQFASYRQRAQDSAAKSALKNLATAQENYYAEHNTYTDAIGDLTFEPEDTITVSLSATTNAWSAEAAHTSSDNTWFYDSEAGGLDPNPR